MNTYQQGIWRSYRTFCFSGKIENHSSQFYLELALDEDGSLTLMTGNNRRTMQVYPAGQWRWALLKKRKFLYLGKRQAFEVITFEPEEIVLHDIVKGEKIFFTSKEKWPSRFENVNSSGLISKTGLRIESS